MKSLSVKEPEPRVPVRAADAVLELRRRVRDLEAVSAKEQDAARKLARIVDSARDPIISKTLDGIVTSWNPAAEVLFGYTAAEMIGQPILRIVPPERLGEEEDILNRLRAGQSLEHHETVRLTKTSRRVAVEITVSPIKNSAGAIVGATKIVRDITERKQAEQALLELNLALTYAMPGISLVTPDGRYITVNEAYARMLGYEPREMIGKDWQATVHPDDRPNAMAAYNRMLRDGKSEFEERAVRKDGSVFHKDALIVRRVDNHGSFLGHHCFMKDISERKEAEDALARAQEQLQEHASTLEKTVEQRTARLREMVDELQQLSYTIAHDMRAPLRAMAAFAHLLLEQSSRDGASSENQQYCRRIVAAAGRLDQLIHDALSYSKAVLQDLPLRPVDLSKLLRDIIETYPNLQADKADIRIEGELPEVLGNESLVTQCFSNLLGNAVKFVAPGTRPQVRIWADTSESISRVWIHDNGIGIAKDAQSRLFGMFQKLDNQYEGSGIGLAIVRKVAERMGGKVGVESKMGEGSRFWVELPIASRQQPKA